MQIQLLKLSPLLRRCVVVILGCIPWALAVGYHPVVARQDDLSAHPPIAVLASLTDQKSCDAVGGIYQEALFLSITVLNTGTETIVIYPDSHTLELVVG